VRGGPDIQARQRRVNQMERGVEYDIDLPVHEPAVDCLRETAIMLPLIDMLLNSGHKN
jgi:hypothetical protein